MRYQGRDADIRARGRAMAIDPAGGHPAMDYPEHLRTYSGFVRGTVIMIVLIILTLLFLLSLVP
jgi:hypothetical protein